MSGGDVNVSAAFLSTKLADKVSVRRLWILVLFSSLIFFAAVPFAKISLFQIPAFIPIYVTALIICDLITAVILFNHFSVLKYWSLLALAAGYSFTATMTAAYALIFPGLFSQTGLLGSGSQTSSAMYMFWHAGFPLFVMSYSALKKNKKWGEEIPTFRGKPVFAIVLTVAAVLVVVTVFSALVTFGKNGIPEFLQGNHTTSLGHFFLASIWVLSLLALIVLFFRRPYTVLDIWLMIVASVWLFDLALSAMLNGGRYDLGWYTGRIYGLMASSFLLILLLIENAAHYARLYQLSIELSIANQTLELLSSHDALTGLANRRSFDKYLFEQISIANRYKRPLSLILCDVDHFKSFNDHYGHQAGDDCLKRVSKALRSCCRRPADMAARYGGEEFVLILPETDLEGVKQIAEAARAAVLQSLIPHAHSPTASHVTISSGVALLAWEPPTTPEDLLLAADRALYDAKNQGRNRVVFAST